MTSVRRNSHWEFIRRPRFERLEPRLPLAVVDFQWTGAANDGGDFHTKTNWIDMATGGVPDLAPNFGLHDVNSIGTGTDSIKLFANAVTGDIEAHKAGTVNLDLNGKTLDGTGVMAGAWGALTTLSISSSVPGAILDSRNLTAGSLGQANVTLDGPLWKTSLDVTVGWQGSATLKIVKGGMEIDNDDIYVGAGTYNTTGSGELTLDGEDTYLYAGSGDLQMGTFPGEPPVTGNVRVLNGEMQVNEVYANRGSLTVGDQLSASGDVTVQADAAVMVDGGSLLTGDFDSLGNVLVLNSGQLSSSNTVNVINALLRVDHGSVVQAVNGGSSSASTVVANNSIFGSLLGNITLSGTTRVYNSGLISALEINNLGEVMAGDGGYFQGRFLNLLDFIIGLDANPNQVQVDGDFEQDGGGALFVDISAAGSDTLNVTGSATLDGKLEVSVSGDPIAPWAGGFSGDYFPVVAVSGSLSTQFNSVVGLPDPNPLADPFGMNPAAPGYTYAWKVVYETDSDLSGYSVPWNGNSTDDVVLLIMEVPEKIQAADDSYGTDEDAPITVAAAGVLANDLHLEALPMTAELDTTKPPQHGTVTMNSDGSFTYTPDPDYHGQDSFGYKAIEGTNVDYATVTIDVAPVNDQPVALPNSVATDEDTELWLYGLLGDGGDPGISETLTYAIGTQPAHGTIADFDPGTGTLRYIPDPNFDGTDAFTFTITDDGTGGSGGPKTSTPATVTITVNPINDHPVAEYDSYSVAEDTTLVVSAPGVLGNDSDADGDPLTAALDSIPMYGTVTLNADGSFTYTPDADFNGTDSFGYEASDGSTMSPATVTITVNPVNDAPVAVDDNYSVDEDSTLNEFSPGVLGNDTDSDGDGLTATLVAGPSNGALTFNSDGSFDYLPTADFHGSDSFTYKANDGMVDSNLATVTITVNSVNDDPVAVDDNYSTDEDMPLTIAAPGVLSNDTDGDGDPLTATLTYGVSNGTLVLNADGSFTYTPDADFNGIDSFGYEASDGSTMSPATVTITVNPVNDAPVANDDYESTDQDIYLMIGVTGNDSDVEADPLTITAVSQGSNGSVTNEEYYLTYTPNPGFTGSDSFTYTIGDGNGGTSTATVYMTVNPTTPFLLSQPELADSNAKRLTQEELKPIIEEAGRRWIAAGVAASVMRQVFDEVDFVIADLSGSRLGATGSSAIYIDSNAAGYGWFVDQTPGTDSEFQRVTARTERQAVGRSDAVGRADLLTAVMHEIGHWLGLPHDTDGHHLMTGDIGLGTRRLPTFMDFVGNDRREREQAADSFFERIGS